MIFVLILTISSVIVLSMVGWGFLTFMFEWVDEAERFEFVDPKYIGKHCRVNIFGLCLLTIITHIFCPIPAILHWLYKLSTVGVRDAEE